MNYTLGVPESVIGGAGFNRCKPCRYGYMLYNINDLHVGRSLDLYGEWAELEMTLLKRFVKPDDTVIDVGANIGTHTLFFARSVGAGGRVFAFEPQRVVFQTLCANAALNSLQNIVALPAAVADRRTNINVPVFDYSQERNYGGVHMGGDARGETAPTVVIDDFNLAGCGLLKIDVEGMEPFVLDGCRKTIERCKPIIYIENNTTQGSVAIISRLEAAGYDMYWHFSPFFNPNNFFGNTDNIFGTTWDANMLCCPKGLRVDATGLVPVLGDGDTAVAAAQRTTGGGVAE